jgi:hypothetical protein
MALQRPSRRALSFALTFDYRCPFARNVHEHVLTGLEAGAPWDVRFVGFSLLQVHVAAGDPDVWDDPRRAADLLALQAGVAVREGWPERFGAVHRGLFTARHERGLDLRDEDVVGGVLAAVGVDPAAVSEQIAGGGPLRTLRSEHEAAAREHSVFGVPTVIVGPRAVFLRLMTRPGSDADVAIATVERLVDLAASWPELNELKHTTVPR